MIYLEIATTNEKKNKEFLVSSKDIDLTQIEADALGANADYSNFVPTRRNSRQPDLLPNRLAKFWLYINTLRSQKDFYLIVSRERVMFDLQIKESTLLDYIKGTQQYKHLWQKQGGFLNFATIYGGNLMVVFAGYGKNKEGDVVAKVHKMRGSLYELTDIYIRNKNKEIEDQDNDEDDLEDLEDESET